ncbi:hypothetical protein GCM10009111_06140 [Colwellia asteriadis]|uniref:Uncharacterized protein n=1 Tax=Colwellia asteriadis TaxID=517723 RepID=A0ABN1L3M3_9GAMM
MVKILSSKSVVLSVGLMFGMSSAYAGSCYYDCDSYAKSQRIQLCADNRGGSACATSEAIYNYFYQQCQQGNC